MAPGNEQEGQEASAALVGLSFLSYFTMLYFGTGSMMQAVAFPAGFGMWCIDPCLSRDHMRQTWASLHAAQSHMIDEPERRALWKLKVVHGSQYSCRGTSNGDYD